MAETATMYATSAAPVLSLRATTSDKVKDALEKVAKAEQDVIDKTNELNKALYGEDNHKNKLDALYNYTTALNQFTKEASRAKEALESSKAGDNV